MRHPISVVIADADGARRIECGRRLCQERHLRLVAQAARSEDVLPLVARHRPVILVLGLNLYDEDGGDPLAALYADYPETKVVLLPAQPGREEDVLRALLNGARAYLTHDTLRQQLGKALHGVNEGEAWVPRKMLGRILDRAVDGRVRDGMGDCL